MNSWKNYEAAAEKGPLQILFKVFFALVFFAAVAGVVGAMFGWFGEAQQVARQELGPQALLEKYTWFKDASANLDKLQADIGVYQVRISALEDDYKGTPRKDWPRDSREQLATWRAEVAGIAAAYNGLAAEYNAAMVKTHWQFANAGELPQGAGDPVKREYRPYKEQ